MKRSVIFQLLLGGLTFLTLAGCHSGSMKQKPILSDSAQIALKEIRKDNTFYPAQYIGEAGTETPQYGYADLLGRSCDANTLEWLCRNDSSYIVRACAYRQLRRKSAARAVAMFHDSMADTYVLWCQSGCTRYCNSFAETLQSINSYDHDSYPLPPKAQNEIDSLLFFSHQQTDLLQQPYTLSSLQPQPYYYPILRKAMLQGNYAPVAAIAKYKKTADLPLIQAALKAYKTDDFDIDINNLTAVTLWPDPSFEWFVKNMCQGLTNKEEYFPATEELIEALLAYPKPWSYKVLETLMAGGYESTDKLQSIVKLKESYERKPRPYFKALYDKYASNIQHLRQVSVEP